MYRHSMLAVCLGALACVPDAPSSKVGPDEPNPPPPVRDAGSTVQTPRDGGITAAPVDAGTTTRDGGVTMTPDAGFRDGGVLPTGLPILGNGQHTMNAVTKVMVADSNVGHDVPTDLAFHPTRPNELWVVNKGDNTVWIATNPGEAGMNAEWRGGPSIGRHFLPRPSSLAFGDNGNFATIHEEDRITQPTTPADFMGPTLWPSNMSIFDGGHSGHIDMLHNTPNGMGIAWETGNAFWVFDGYHSSLTRYDFNRDHGPGGSDHSDGDVGRYVEGEVSRVADVPSHMEFHAPSRTLYVADTGNNRIAMLDVDSGTRGRSMGPNYDGGDQYRVNGATITTFVDGSSAGLMAPSGLAIHDGHVFVGDNALGTISAFAMDDGELVDWVDTGVSAGALTGLAFDAAGRLYFADQQRNEIIRIEAKD